METLTQACTQHSGAILVMLTTAFGFGLLLGYVLWNKYLDLSRQHSTEREEWRSKYVDRDSEYQTLELDHQKNVAEHRSLRNSHTSLEAENRGLNGELNFLRESAAKSQPARTGAAIIVPDDYYPVVGTVPKSEFEALRKRYDKLEVDYASSQTELAMLTKRLDAPRMETASAKTAAPAMVRDPQNSFQAPPGDVNTRSLPANVVALLHAKHIYDWPDLAALEPRDLQALLASENHAYVPAQLSAWIAQARRMIGDARPLAAPEEG